MLKIRVKNPKKLQTLAKINPENTEFHRYFLLDTLIILSISLFILESNDIAQQFQHLSLGSFQMQK